MQINKCAPVLLIFFNRPVTLNKVFEQIKKAKPPILLLYQDGARNEKEQHLIEECRKVVEHIDWDCKVYKYYQEKNIGCDPSEYIAQRWAFSIVDKCIILEDDDLPSNTFFEFCTVMLDRYENNNSISIISGLNHLGKYQPRNNGDYIFTKNISIWGWASWSRVINNWDPNYSEFKELGPLKFAKKYHKEYPTKVLSDTIQEHIRSGREHYETILIYNHLVNNQLSIVPTKNLIRNIGNDIEGGTHSASSTKLLPRAIEKVLSLETYNFEIKDTNNLIIEDKNYSKKVYRIMAWDHPLISLFRRIEVMLKKAKYCLFKRKIDS